MLSPKSMLRRLVPVALAVAIIGAPSAAQATEVTIDINPGNVPTTAEGHGDHSCDQVPDDIGDDQDGWVFVLPSDHGDKGKFVLVTATFEDTEGVEHTYNTDDNGGIVESGTSKAYIITPAGWTLTGATAEVTGVGEDAKFNLTHTCPGKGGENPSESPSPSDSGSATPGDGTSSPGGDDELPVTGSSLTTPLIAGLVLALAGVIALVLAQRRRVMAMRDNN